MVIFNFLKIVVLFLVGKVIFIGLLMLILDIIGNVCFWFFEVNFEFFMGCLIGLKLIVVVLKYWNLEGFLIFKNIILDVKFG